MLLDYTGKRVLITGGGRGLGLAMAAEMARRGAVLALASRTLAQLDDAVRELETLGASAHALPVDLYDVEQARQLVSRAAEAMGGLDILVNNAGGWRTVPGAAGPIINASVEGFELRLRPQCPVSSVRLDSGGRSNDRAGDRRLHTEHRLGRWPGPRAN